MGNQPKYPKMRFVLCGLLAVACVGFIPYFFATSSPEAINCGNTSLTAYAVKDAGIEAAINAATKAQGFDVSNAHEAAMAVMPRSWNATDSVTLQFEQGEKRICKIDGSIVWAKRSY